MESVALLPVHLHYDISLKSGLAHGKARGESRRVAGEHEGWCWGGTHSSLTIPPLMAGFLFVNPFNGEGEEGSEGGVK